MNSTTLSDTVNHKPLHIFMIVSVAILVSETIAVVMIGDVRNLLEEICEVLILTALISSMVYYLLIRPLQAEIALRQSTENNLTTERDRLEQVTKAIGAGLAIIDRDYRVIWTNHIMSQKFRSTPGVSCYNALKQRETPCDECGVREVFEKSLVQCSSIHRLIDTHGKEGWYQVIVTPIRDKDGIINSALELLVPFDDRKMVEEQLALNQQQFQSLVESSNDWVWEVDAEGRYSYVGPQCRELLGYESEEVLGKTPFMFMTTDEAVRVESIFKELTARQQSFKLLENILVHKDGHLVVMETSGTPFFNSAGTFLGYRGIDRDISERKALEELEHNYQLELERQVQHQTHQLQQLIDEQNRNFIELQSVETSLRQSEIRFRQIFEQNRDALILFDFETRQVMDANPVAQIMFAGTCEMMLSMSWEDFQIISETGKPLKLDEIARQTEFMMLQGGVKTLDGKSLVVSLWGKILQLGGKAVAYCSLRDITDKTRMEKEARLIQTKLIQTNKMTSLGFLVAGIAHEINNPNNNILLSTQLLEGIWQDIEPIVERRYREEGDFVLGGVAYSEMRESVPNIFNMITDGSRRIEIIINNLRDFTIKSKSELRQLVDINRIVSISASILQHQIKKHTRNFSLELSPDNLMVKGNKQQLEQVVVNLIVNAIQALSSLDLSVRVTTGYDATTESVVISVIDKGSGIPSENLPYVFEPFFSTKLESGGTGLGLAISSNIIKEHGGRLELASSPESGTTATISLPGLREPYKEIQP